MPPGPRPGPRTLFSAARVVGQTESAADGEYTLALEGSGVFAVAEGVGRGVPADVAATASLRAIDRRLGGRRLDGPPAPREAARLGLDAANGEVWRLATAQSAYPDMSASVGLLVLDSDRAAFLGTGGVRMLRWRDGRLGLLHGPVGNLRRRLGEAPEMNMRAVGLAMAPGDVYLLASQGLERALSSVGELTRALERGDPEQVIQQVTEIAREKGHEGRLALVSVTVGGGSGA